MRKLQPGRGKDEGLSLSKMSSRSMKRINYHNPLYESNIKTNETTQHSRNYEFERNQYQDQLKLQRAVQKA